MSDKFKIFVVDDETTISFTLAAILRVNGFAAESFTNPLRALEAAAGSSPHLLLSDVSMPQMSGVDLAMQILAVCPECKVLLFSGQAATTDLLRAAREQGFNFKLLEKPVHPQELLEAVREQQFALPN
jgi:DNA-binding NtrC family response regulator